MLQRDIMVIRSLAFALLFVASISASGQTAKPPVSGQTAKPRVSGETAKPLDLSAGPVPPAIQQMPDRFQPPVPGCTDCFYTVPTGKLLGAMGTTNNEGVKVTDPLPTPAGAKPGTKFEAKANPSASALPPSTYNDLVFKSGAGVRPVPATAPLPLYIGSAAGLNRMASASRTLASACNLHSVDYTTQAGTPTNLSIPLSLWDVTTKTKLADLPADWNSRKQMTYTAVNIGKVLPPGHKLQVRLTQPASSALPVNFQFTINVVAHCLKDSKSAAHAAVKATQH